MKASRYNHFIPFSEGQSIAYNALSNALALIENEKLAIYDQFTQTGKVIKDDSLRSDLLRGNFILEDNIDELDVVRYNMLRGRFATNTLSLTIAPTSDCNFRCIYCYQKKVLCSDYMSDEVQDAVVQILESQRKLIHTFNVTWYGGEPLLALSIIKRLSNRFIDICNQENISYSANIITNGYLLTRNALEALKDSKVEFMQVTLDGGPDQHNEKRPLADGSETFWTILNNLRDGYDLLPRVSLRVSVDHNNTSAGNTIKKFVEEYEIREKVTPYFGRLRNDNDCYDDDKCLNDCDFAEIEYSYALAVAKPDSTEAVRYPTSKSSFCGADTVSYSVIAADGSLYRCWSDVGNPKKCVGNVLKPFSDLNAAYLEYILFDPTQIPPCRECDILPVCMGGCPFQRINRGSQQCSRYKYVLELCLKNAATKLKNVLEISNSLDAIE